MTTTFRSVTAPRGFRAAAGTAGIKQSGGADLAVIVADAPARAAAVFTTNTVCSEAVQVGRKHVEGGSLRAIVVNSGCANASTGKLGRDNARRLCAAVASKLGCELEQVLSCSTGRIGEQLPMDRILPAVDSLLDRLGSSSKEDADAARAIMTTDLAPKAGLRIVRYGEATVTLGAIAKGSGMIAPNMATMLAFITTDVDISLPLLRSALTDAVNADASFNRLSVDTDTSPSDTVAVMASGKAEGAPAIRKKGKDYDAFAAALSDLCKDLAYQIIADGEGATKVIRVIVTSAKSMSDAVKVARTVADSPLVKTAVHGGDPNWGRITAAVGRSGASFDPARFTVSIGPVAVYAKGGPADADPHALERIMQDRELVISIDLKAGKHRTEVLGCDLSREYVSINADYRT